MERIFLNLTLNTRDIGGYQSTSGKQIKMHRIIRSDALRYINENDKQNLLKFGIKNQIDLRTEEIALCYPSMLEKDKRFNYYSIPLKEGSLKSLDENPDIPSLYMKMVGNCEAFRNIFKKIAFLDDGIIINCTAGKDRTGIVIYMLLKLCDVDDKTIKKDYLYSQACIDEMLPKVRKAKPTFPKFLGYAKEEYYDKFTEMFNEKYHSVVDYLLGVGISQEEIDTIVKKMF